MKPSFKEVEVVTKTNYVNTNTVGSESVYGSSVSFIDFCDDNWEYRNDVEIIPGIKQSALIGLAEYDTSLINVLQNGDCILAKDNTVDYTKIDPSFGTNEDLKKLVKTAHKKGIRIVLDGVFNHSGWFFFAWQDVLKKGEKSKYKDWYFIKDYDITSSRSSFIRYNALF